jgi:hypothetical protein
MPFLSSVHYLTVVTVNYVATIKVIAVGQHGLHQSFGAGGGGGTFVVVADERGPNSHHGVTPLVIAGGGGSGAACSNTRGGSGRIEQSG